MPKSLYSLDYYCLDNIIHMYSKSINTYFLQVRTHPSSIVKHREFCLVLQLLRFSKLSMINVSVAKFLHKGDICCLWKPTLFIQQSQDAWRIVLWRSFSKVSDINFCNNKTSLLQRKTSIKSVPVTAPAINLFNKTTLVTLQLSAGSRWFSLKRQRTRIILFLQIYTHSNLPAFQ